MSNDEEKVRQERRRVEVIFITYICGVGRSAVGEPCSERWLTRKVNVLKTSYLI